MIQNKIIKVAQVIGEAAEGGVESCVMNYFRNIDHSKVEFTFFVESTSRIINKQEIEELGGKVVFIPSMKKIFTYQKIMKKLFKEGGYDIVHAHKTALNIFTLRAAKKAGIKVRISHAHSTSNKKEWKRNIIKALLRPLSKKYATHYFACSELAGRWLFGDKTFNDGQVTIVNNAIDIDRFKFNQIVRDEIRKEYNISDKFVIGHVGRFMMQKNHEFLIDIFYEIQKIKPESILFLIGDGPLKEEILNKAKELKIDSKIIFAGVHKDVYRYYHIMDCFLFPSLYEGLGMVAIEAQVNGLPCFLSNEVPKIAKINDNAYFISLDRRAKEWAEEICGKSKVYESEEKLISRKKYADNFLETQYDIRFEANNLLQKYKNLIKNNCE